MRKPKLGRRGLLNGLPAIVSSAIATRAITGRAKAQSTLPTVRIGCAVGSFRHRRRHVRIGPDSWRRGSRWTISGSSAAATRLTLYDAEFERRPDLADQIARQWFERDGVAAIVDLPGTAAPVRVQDVARAHDRTVLNTSSFNTALTGARVRRPPPTGWKTPPP